MALLDVGYELLEELRRAGIGGLNGVELLRMGRQAVSAEYIKEMRELGFKPAAEELLWDAHA